MSTFTVITQVLDSFHLSQHGGDTPERALADHISRLPHNDASGPFDDELEWLQEVAGGERKPTLVAVGGCQRTWMWLEGSRHAPRYTTYIVQTEVPESDGA